MTEKRNGITTIEVLVALTIVCILAALLLPLASGCGNSSNQVIGSVKRVYEKGDVHYVAVTLSNGDTETFTNRDNPFYGKYNSTTLQDSLDVGKTYQFTVQGFRNEAFTYYRNILKAEEKAGE